MEAEEQEQAGWFRGAANDTCHLPWGTQFGTSLLPEPNQHSDGVRMGKDGKQHMTPDVCAPAHSHSLLTFLVLEPELLLDLLAGEVDGAAELGAVQRLRDVVGAKLLDEGEQLFPAAVLVQDLQDVCKACGREAGGGEVSQTGRSPRGSLLRSCKTPLGSSSSSFAST